MDNKIIVLNKFQVESWRQIYGLQDARHGGLVLGNRHSKGCIESGIKLVNPISPDTYGLFEMEGGEYLMCSEATKKYKKRLTEINSYKGSYDEISEERIKNLFSVIKPATSMEMLVLSGKEHYIINRNATSKYLEELDEMNKKALIESLKCK